MALGDVYTEQEVDSTIDQLLPVFNQPGSTPIPRDVARAIARAENMGKKGDVTFANLRSPANATGVMQVIPSTIRGLRGKYLAPDFPEDLTDQTLAHQVMAGLATMREMIDRKKYTKPEQIATAYNSGMDYDTQAGKLPVETQGYLRKVSLAMGKLNGTALPPSPATIEPGGSFTVTPYEAARGTYESVTASMPAVFSALFGAQANAAQQGQVQQAAVGAAGEAAATAARAQAEITIQEGEYHRKLLRAVGLDIEDPASALNAELTKEAGTRRTREALRSEITKLQSVSFFQNPLEFLMNQPQLQGMVAQHNELADVENRSTSEIARMQSLAQSVKSLTPAKSADLIRSKAAADATALLEKTKYDQAAISAQNSAGQAKLALDAFTLKRNTFSDALQITNAEEANADRDANRKLRELQFDTLLDDRRNRRADAKAKEDEKAGEAQKEAALITGLNLYSRAIKGGTVEWTKEDLKRMDPKIRSEWYEVIIRGNYGNSYGESIPFIERYGNAAAASESGNATMMQLVRNIKARVEPKTIETANKLRMANPLARVDPAAVRQMVYDEMYQTDTALANKGSDKSVIEPTSPYAIPWDAVAVAASQAKQQTVISKILVDAKARNPNMPLDRSFTPRRLIEELNAQVVAGATTPQQAAMELSTFMREVTNRTYEDNGLKYLGLPRFSDFQITPGMTGAKKVDLFNPAQLENYLTSQVATTKRARSIGIGRGTGGFGIFN